MIRCKLVKFWKTPHNQATNWSNHVRQIAEVFQNWSYAAIGYAPFDHGSRWPMQHGPCSWGHITVHWSLIRNENGRSNPIIHANSLDRIKLKVEKIQNRLGQLVTANIASNATNIEKTIPNLDSIVFDTTRKVSKKSTDRSGLYRINYTL